MRTLICKFFVWGIIAMGLATWTPARGGQMETPMLRGLTPQQFITDSAIDGMKEIRMSELAVTTSQNEDVKRLAQRMVTDHSAINDKLEIIANQEHLTFPATNTFAASDPLWDNQMVEHPGSFKDDSILTTNVPNLVDYQDIKHLRGLLGREFDETYAKTVLNDHITMIDEFTAASENLTDPKLKRVAADMLPALREHSRLAQKLDNQFAKQSASNEKAKAGGTPVAIINAGDR